MAQYDFLDGERIRKAHSVRNIPAVFQSLAISLARAPVLRYIKIFPDRIAASNMLSDDGKKNPVVVIGAEGIVAVELLVDVRSEIVQFYALTSATKGYGRQIIDAVVSATPEGWFLAVPMDWSGGVWEKMAEEYPRLALG